jgi:hypothetical protein
MNRREETIEPPDHEWARLLYQITIEDINRSKKQQWMITNYVLILFAVILGLENKVETVCLEQKLYLFIPCILISLLGIYHVLDNQYNQVRYRKTIVEIRRKYPIIKKLITLPSPPEKCKCLGYLEKKLERLRKFLCIGSDDERNEPEKSYISYCNYFLPLVLPLILFQIVGVIFVGWGLDIYPSLRCLAAIIFLGLIGLCYLMCCHFRCKVKKLNNN